MTAYIRQPSFVRTTGLLLTWIMPLLIVADTLNGVLLRLGGGSISQPVKIILLLFLALYCAHYKKGIRLVLVCITVDIFYLSLHALMSSAMDAITLDLQWLLRFNILWLGFFVFKSLFDLGVLSQRWLIRTFACVSLMLACNLFLGFLGYGYSQYGSRDQDLDQIGAVGFIYAGNEMSFLLLVCQIVLSGFIYKRNSSIVGYLVISIVFFLFSIMKATKVAMLGSLLVTLWFPFFELMRGISSLKLRSRRVPLFFALLILGSIIVAPVAISLIERVGIIDRMKYFANQNGILFAIFSGRELTVAQYFNEVWSKNNFIQYIFGVGRFNMLAALSGRPVEIDPVDLLGGFGIFGVIICYGYFVMRAAPSLKKVIYTGAGWHDVILALVFFAFAISITGGHVMYSGLALPYLALAFGFFAAQPKQGNPSISTT